ncbi:MULTISPECIES: AAA family ATPase [unclassified Clostridium]|uniref:AAA family ATPase n=1 Tax=unclassified Clostridium TaxID=2614128 RepID=UPI0002974626|nr:MULTISPECIES: AAA family ATPase [unclassified Clostridium]EKQ58058.1 MAG: AAA+ family ATPase [Clostridium sp. Maddingley MBC34-26]
MNKIDLIKKIVEANKEDASSWYLLGIEYKEVGQVKEALSAFTEALKYCTDEIKIKIIDELSSLKIGDSVEIKGTSKIDDSIRVEETQNQEGENEPKSPKLELVKLQSEENVGNNIISFEAKKTLNNNENVTFDDVGGLSEVKKAISMKIIKPFENPGLFSMFNKKIGGGVLLFGPPGCGKTFIAKATAGECKAKFINVHITDILDKFIGESEKNIRLMFEEAKMKKPCVLFFDEIDTLGYSRLKLSSQYLRGVIDQFLCEMDGLDSSKDKVMIMGATNTPWDIDAAFKRPGRFDRVIFVEPPDKEARKVIFKLKLEGKPIEDIDYNVLAQGTELYSGADIENVVDMAAEKVIDEIMESGIERKITQKDLISAIKQTHPSTIEWLKTVKNYITYSNQSGFYDDVKKYISSVKNI